MLITTIFDKNGSDNNNIVNRLTNDKVNNKFLSEMLNVSKPAITKSIKKYEEVLKVFDNDEMAVIVEFLNRSIEELKKEEDGLND